MNGPNRLTNALHMTAAASRPAQDWGPRAVAEELARKGPRVAICARTARTFEEAAAHIQKTTGREVLHQALDVTDSEAVAAAETRFGWIEICVTNSGGPPSNVFKNTKPEDWRAALDQLLMSTVSFARDTLPRMQKNK